MECEEEIGAVRYKWAQSSGILPQCSPRVIRESEAQGRTANVRTRNEGICPQTPAEEIRVSVH